MAFGRGEGKSDSFGCLPRTERLVKRTKTAVLAGLAALLAAARGRAISVRDVLNAADRERARLG
jgi:hypothetical protein